MTLFHRSSVANIIPLIILAAAAVFAWQYSLAPRPLPTSAAPDQFSAIRAWHHIEKVCTAPQPAGSLRNDEACAYIQKTLEDLGVETELLFQYDKTGERQVSRRRAVLGRIRGSESGNAFAMDAHFDSVPWGPGAADDWAAVAALLETARALTGMPKLRNDIIFVFADQEEFNMGGAKGFRNHPWFQDVRVMLGLEARGSCGPSLMFETSPENGFVVRELAKAGVGARANSVMYDFYKRMPFNSDFEHYKYDVAGLNVAFVNGFQHYHTMLDNAENISLSSLQHHGNYTLGLARHFGTIPLNDCYGPDAQYFNTLGGHMVVYPIAWGWRLALLALVVFLAVFLYGFLSKSLTWRGVVVGTLIFPITSFFFALVAIPSCYLIFLRFREMALYQNNTFSLGLVAVGTAIFLVVAALLRRWSRPQEMLAGALVWFLVGLMLCQVMLPGGANLTLIPLAFGLVYLLILLIGSRQGEASSPPSIRFSLLFAVPPFMFLTPVLVMPFYTVTSMLSVVLVPGVMLLFSFSLPQWCLLRSARWFQSALALVVIGIVLLGAAYVGCLPGVKSPYLNCLAYGVDYDKNEAWWLSSARQLDPWLARYIPVDATPEKAGAYLHNDNTAYLKGPAPLPLTDPPSLRITADEEVAGKRQVSFIISSPRGPERMWIRVVSDAPVYRAWILGHELSGADRDWNISLEIPPREGVELRLETEAELPLELGIHEKSWGLPAFADFVARPETMAAEPNRTLIRLPLSSDYSYSYATLTVE